MLQHGKVSLALHRLRAGGGRPLLLLHGLGEQSPQSVPGWCAGLGRTVVALDFTGHGRSTVPRGGGYSAETLLADADVGDRKRWVRRPCSAEGWGRTSHSNSPALAPRSVWGAVLADGPGLAGGSIQPMSSSVVTIAPARRHARPVRAARALPRSPPARLRRRVRQDGARTFTTR